MSLPTHRGQARLSYAQRYQLALENLTDPDAPEAITNYVNQLDRKRSDEERAKRAWRSRYRAILRLVQNQTPEEK